MKKVVLSFEDLTLESWENLKEKILRLELVFPEQLRAEEEEYLATLKEPDYVAKVARLNSEYIGNIVGSNARHMIDLDLYDELRDDTELKEKTIHVVNVVIDALYQGHGFGTKLVQEFILEARKKGYDWLVGFFRPNNSLPLVRKFGAREISVHEDWYETGEDYVFCELDLRRYQSQLDFCDFNVPGLQSLLDI